MVDKKLTIVSIFFCSVSISLSEKKSFSKKATLDLPFLPKTIVPLDGVLCPKTLLTIIFLKTPILKTIECYVLHFILSNIGEKMVKYSL